jgi:uncharacterized protein
MFDLTRPPRYSPRELPPYSYVTGQFPHPIRDAAGHSYGLPPETVEPIDESSWRTNATWLWAIDLFNHGFYWEAHEAWEGLWHAAGRRGATADFLKGLIKLAAAGVKHREGRPEGVRRHATRASALLSPSRGRNVFGVNVDLLLAAAERWKDRGQVEDQTLTIWLDFKGLEATGETRIEHG